MSSSSKRQGERAPAAPSDPLVGTVLAGRYRIDSLLGRGARGSVYAAEHVLLHKPVAVKILDRELMKVREIALRFEREAATAANVDHPNVAAAMDFGKLDDGAAFLVLELVRGDSLRAEIAKGPLEAGRAVQILRQIAAGLSAAHEKGIVHRDLKPENLILTSKNGVSDVVKILDFGVAKVRTEPTSRPLTELGVILGTSDYMAPEQALGKSADARSDLYSLGVIAYEMLAGRRPFHDCDENALLERQLAGPPPPLRAQAPPVVVSTALEAIVMRLLSKTATDRYQSAAALIDDLTAMPAPMAVQAPSPKPFVGAAATAATVDALAITEAAPPSLALTPKARTEALLRRAATRIGQPAKTLRRRSVQILDAAAKRVEVQRERIPAPLRAPLQRVSSRAVLAALILVPIALGVGLTFFVASTHEDSPQVAALGSSAAAFAKPVDPRGLAQLELAEAHLEQRSFNAATAAVAQALAHDAALGQSERAAAVLAETARHEASATAALALLQGPMGAKGAEVVYDLAARPQTPQKIRARAEEWLGSEAFRRVASPALGIAGQLRAARRCQEKHAILSFARELGDRRALEYLKILASKTGCGRSGRDDCYPCLRKDTALTEAAKAIERRIGQK